MEPTNNLPPPVVQHQSAAPSNSQGMNISSNNIVSLFVMGIIGGFAFGLGSYLASKATKKKPEAASGTSSMNGMQMMYPPRDPRMAPNNQGNRYPQYMMPQNNYYPNGGFSRFEGSSEFSVDSWLQSNNQNQILKVEELLEKASD